MSLVELAPNYLTLPCESPVRKAVQKAYRWYSAAFSPHDVPRFADVGSLTESPETMRVIRDFFVARYRSMPQPPTHVMGFDARGFLLGSMIAVELNVPFVLMRKVGKNAGVLIRSEPYEKEYASATEEYMTIRHGSIGKGSRVVLIDDVIATGGTALSGFQLADACGATIVEMAGVLGIAALKGAQFVHAYDNGRFRSIPFFVLTDETVLSDDNCGDVANHTGPRVISCQEAKNRL